jgi:hypothetical protein
MYIAGHTQPATTARYLRPQKAAAQEVLIAAAVASGTAPNPSPTPTRSQRGHNIRAPFRAPNPLVPEMPARSVPDPAKAKGPEPSAITGVPGLVRGGGIEPPWLLTASTSTRAEDARDGKLGTFVRQEAPKSGPGRPIPGTVPGIGAGGVEPDRIARELRRAMGVWRVRRDPAALRVAIERLLAMPEMGGPVGAPVESGAARVRRGDR